MGLPLRWRKTSIGFSSMHLRQILVSMCRVYTRHSPTGQRAHRGLDRAPHRQRAVAENPTARLDFSGPGRSTAFVESVGRIIPRSGLAVKPGSIEALGSLVAARAVSSSQVGAQRGKFHRGQSAPHFRGETTDRTCSVGGRMSYRRGRHEGAGRVEHSPRSGGGSHGRMGLVGVRARVGESPAKRPGAVSERASASLLT